MTKEDLAHVLHYDVACGVGQTRLVISDRDPRIDNDFLLSMSAAALQGTSHRLTVSYRPCDNGQAEAYNKEIVTKLKMFCWNPTRRVDWDQSVRECTLPTIPVSIQLMVPLRSSLSMDSIPPLSIPCIGLPPSHLSRLEELKLR
jgi:hypothetical protein